MPEMGKMNAECATEPKTFVFKNEICGVTFKWFPLGFDRNFGEGPGQQTYPFPALCALTMTPVAQSDSGGRAEGRAGVMSSKRQRLNVDSISQCPRWGRRDGTGILTILREAKSCRPTVKTSHTAD